VKRIEMRIFYWDIKGKIQCLYMFFGKSAQKESIIGCSCVSTRQLVLYSKQLSGLRLNCISNSTLNLILVSVCQM
jgi:hypothetical protein